MGRPKACLNLWYVNIEGFLLPFIFVHCWVACPVLLNILIQFNWHFLNWQLNWVPNLWKSHSKLCRNKTKIYYLIRNLSSTNETDKVNEYNSRYKPCIFTWNSNTYYGNKQSSHCRIWGGLVEDLSKDPSFKVILCLKGKRTLGIPDCGLHIRGKVHHEGRRCWAVGWVGLYSQVGLK